MKVLIIFLLMIKTSFAEHCTPVNLVTEPHSPFKHIPVTDQNGARICYAFTAAQMVNYYQIKKGQKHRMVHPAWVALVTERDNDIGALYRSSVYKSINGLAEEGNCSAAYINSSLKKWAKLANASESQFLAMLDNITYNVDKIGGMRSLSNAELKKIFYSGVTSVSARCTPDPVWEMLGPHIRSLSVLNSEKVLKELIFPKCSSPQKIKLPDVKMWKASRLRMLTPIQLDNTLDELRSPIAISYCSTMLANPSYKGLLEPSVWSGTPLKKDCGNHASLIVGKKMIGGKCHFLLRNSWGSGFSKSNRSYKCLCKNRRTGAFVDNCTEKTHNNGQFSVDSCWIDENQLKANVYKMTVLDTRESVTDKILDYFSWQ